jgi:predicted outer membrane protein
MFFKKLVAASFPLVIAGAALADPPPPAGGADMSEKTMNLGDKLSMLHAVSQWATKLSAMAEKKAKSDLVKDYAREMATTSADADTKLKALAEKNGVELKPVSPQTEEGKSLAARMKAETTMLSSLEGDAFDKEYMTLVTNTQQSVINMLEAKKAAATDPTVKQFLDDMTTMVQGRLKKAQDVMAKIYGDTI